MTKLEHLRQQLEDIQTQHEQFQARFDANPELEPSEEEQKLMDENVDRFNEIQAKIKTFEAMQTQNTAASAPGSRRTQPDPVSETSASSSGRGITTYRQTNANNSRHGFAHMGEWGQSVIRAAINPSNQDARLRAEGGMQEGVGADGGFLVPPDFRNTLMTKVMGEESLIGRTDDMTSASNSVTVPVDEVTPWDDTKGFSAYWEGEGKQLTESKGELDQTQVRLNKLTALVRVTEEVLEDAPLMNGYLMRKVPEKMDHKLNMALVRGTGVGMPLGVLNSGFTVEQASSTGAAAIAEFADLSNMYARMYFPWRSSAIWLIHPQIEQRMPQIAFDPTATAGQVPVYLPSNSMAGSPYNTLFGRPVIPCEVCSAPSDPGDIIFASWGQYMTLTKGGAIRQDTSIHAYFDTDEVAFRFILRVGGQPWFKSPIAARTGDFDRSAFVTLADRT